jgi:hypothetical protein
MKRQKFRLHAVLKHYERQKKRAEQDLSLATRALHDIEEEIVRFESEVTALAGMLEANTLSAAGWMACGRRSEHLGRCIDNARVRREHQANVVKQCAEKRKSWAIREESLLSLKHRIETANDAEETKTLQVQLQESMLRSWFSDDADQASGAQEG